MNFKGWFNHEHFVSRHDKYSLDKGFLTNKKRVGKDEFLESVKSNNNIEGPITRLNLVLNKMYEEFKKSVYRNESIYDERTVIKLYNEDDLEDVRYFAEVSFNEFIGINKDSISFIPELICFLKQLVCNGVLYNKEELSNVEMMIDKVMKE